MMDTANDILLKKVSAGDSRTIVVLLKELDQKLRKSFLRQGLKLEDIEEILLDSITILIQNIRKGEFEDRGIPVIAYLIKVAKIRSYQYLRKNKLEVMPLTSEILTHCNGEVKELEDWDRVKAAINQLPSNQKYLIELTYFKNISDNSILEKNLTPYSSIESIRTQRHKAIKKLCSLLNGKP